MNRFLAAWSISLQLNRRNLLFPVTNKQWYHLGLLLSSLGFCLLSTVITPKRAIAAQGIYLSYGVLERRISVDALETYAKTGKLDDDLAAYVEYFSPQQLDQLRSVLLTKIELTPVAVSQFLYTPIGETLLQRLGQVVQTEARQPGFYAIRGALILAAGDPQGLTLLNVLKYFPTRNIRLNLRRSLQISEEIETLVNQTRQAIALITQQSINAASAQPSVNFSQLPDLRRRGRFSWTQQTLTLNDRRRNRTFPADIYLPNVTKPAPVIVISHGLGSDRTSFAYLAQQLASYGFAVAVPEHPGSNAQQLNSLLSGRTSEVAEANEFINRPLDVKYLLNQLQRLDASNPNLQLNMQQVGVIGQSFGGYTALALAGAKLNFDNLKQECEHLSDSLNVSLLLQCQALQLPLTRYNLQDPRIKAAIAINPITSSIFGEAGLRQIKIPVMIVSSSADTIAPALPEQLIPFTWLTAANKYLILLERGTHFSTIGESNPSKDPIAIPAQVIGPNPAIARRYINALSVALFEVYLAGGPQYRPYLSSSYAQFLSQSELSLSLVQSLPTAQLTQSQE